MITEFAAAAGLVYGYQRIKDIPLRALKLKWLRCLILSLVLYLL